MLLTVLKKNKTAINKLAVFYGAKHVRIFGSVARCEESGSSDVDILVHFPKGYNMFEQRLPLVRELSKLIGRKVDLVPEHELNRHLRRQILSEAVEL